MGDILINAIIGIFILISGIFIKKYKIGMAISLIDLRKFDNDKVSEIAGIHLIILGALMLLISLISFIDRDIQEIAMKSLIFITISIMLSTYYKIIKYAKLVNNNN